MTDRLAHYQTMADAASVPGLFELLREARAALGPEFYDLAGRIDDALPGHREPHDSQGLLSLTPDDTEPVPYLLTESAYRILREMDQ